ncbi:profilin-1-like [Brachionichthys hirsutus]|uniref:profilin-1-like n=1 Tax=Brachionichthys hirsutus TaxID=412623 RepID=UPI0036047DBB
MSGWQGYVTAAESKTDGKSAKIVMWAAVCSKADNSIWAKSDSFKLETAEVQKLMGDRKRFCESGPSLGGAKCMLIKDKMETDRLMYFRSKAPCGQSVHVAVKTTNKAVIIMASNPGIQPAELNKIIDEMQEHLLKNDY